MAHRYRRIALAALLVISTALWGNAVASHYHLDQQDHPCDICLLPHAADIAADAAALPPVPASTARDRQPNHSHKAALVTAYQSRAPPR